MSETWKLIGIKIGMPSIDTLNNCTTVRVTVRALLLQEDRLRTAFDRQKIQTGGFDEALEASVVLSEEGIPDGGLGASGVKELVTCAIHRAIAEARTAATAWIEVLDTETLMLPVHPVANPEVTTA